MLSNRVEHNAMYRNGKTRVGAGWRWVRKLSVLFRYIMVCDEDKISSRNIRLAVGM